MAFEVVMPRLGWNMEQGALAGWRKKDGDQVRAGEILFDVESDKAVQEVEALESGTLRIPAGSPPIGTPVPVGTLLAWLLAPGEEMPAGPRAVPGAAAPAVAAPAAASPAATGKAAENTPASTGRSAPAPAELAGRPARRAISPRARRVARELGVEWGGIKGSGRTGRIVERDVRAASRASSAAAATGKGRPAAAAAALLTTEADAAELVRLHDQFQAHEGAAAPSYADFFVRMVGLALQRHPALNERGGRPDAVIPVHVGVSVDTEAGLAFPVIRNAQSASLIAISREASRLAGRARDGTLTAEERSGATFTVIDLGGFEIDTLAPAIAPPAPVLAVGRITPRQTLMLSLSFDAGQIDLGAAARFLQQVKHAVERPLYWIAGVI